ncbi:DMT family transporter [Pseudoalteromonas shioyasakiensis]|uniref:DMT family transporter n=1 Tax=Pseudoalteromonas shioyasakiensis TaxID=1190813 RepID=UPI002118FD3C|nr:DMT family transporter [Pseudoalteromonas shioyasakiensis]MCQ8877474.1 DMT family transporter [Pseudoalteromonas shioyasakiensis]
MPLHFKPSLFMLLSTFTLSINGLLSKLLTEYFDDALLVLLRLLVPAIIMLLIVMLAKWAVPNKEQWRPLFIRAVFIASCQSCFMLALSRLSLIEAVVLFSTGPLFIPFIERILFSTKLSWLMLPTFTLMVLGVVIQNITVQGISWRWDLLLGLAAGFFNGCSQVALFRASKVDLPVMVINGWSFAFAAMIVMPVLALTQPNYTASLIHMSELSWGVVTLLIMLGFSTASTQFYRSKAYRLVASNSELAPLIYTNLIFAFLFQILFYDTNMTWLQVVGTGLIILASLLNTFGPRYLDYWKLGV